MFKVFPWFSMPHFNWWHSQQNICHCAITGSSLASLAVLWLLPPASSAPGGRGAQREGLECLRCMHGRGGTWASCTAVDMWLGEEGVGSGKPKCLCCGKGTGEEGCWAAHAAPGGEGEAGVRAWPTGLPICHVWWGWGSQAAHTVHVAGIVCSAALSLQPMLCAALATAACMACGP